MSNISEEIFKNLNVAVDNAIRDILKDMSKRYSIEFGELETEYISENNKKKKNGYNKYNSKRRKELQEEKNNNMGFGEMSKIIGKEWANMTEEEKKAYS